MIISSSKVFFMKFEIFMFKKHTTIVVVFGMYYLNSELDLRTQNVHLHYKWYVITIIYQSISLPVCEQDYANTNAFKYSGEGFTSKS